MSNEFTTDNYDPNYRTGLTITDDETTQLNGFPKDETEFTVTSDGKKYPFDDKLFKRFIWNDDLYKAFLELASSTNSAIPQECMVWTFLGSKVYIHPPEVINKLVEEINKTSLSGPDKALELLKQLEQVNPEINIVEGVNVLTGLKFRTINLTDVIQTTPLSPSAREYHDFINPVALWGKYMTNITSGFVARTNQPYNFSSNQPSVWFDPSRPASAADITSKAEQYISGAWRTSKVVTTLPPDRSTVAEAIRIANDPFTQIGEFFLDLIGL